MNRSEHIGGLAKALATAQGQIEDAVKSKTNPHFRSAYADLAAVRAAIQKPLSENGLAYTQLLSTSADGLTIETMLIHGDSGEFISEALTLPLAQPSSQAIGSAASYGRRYSLMAILGIAADDDDGNAAQAAAPASPALGKAKWGASSQAKKRGDWEAFQDDLRDVHSVVMLDKLQKEYRTNFYPKWSQAWRDQAEQIFDRHRQDFTTDAEPPMPL